ncbi:MAG: ATP-binding cassette domain-containing protein [Acidimicrobiaceae bacterium]|nr:ATP-binding cassette domain-containing protein [Acidimicrobiaceae bacterium]
MYGVKSVGFRGLFSALALALALFLVLPIAVLAYYGLKNISHPSSFSQVGEATWVSLAASIFAVGVSLLIGVPLGYLLARSKSPWSRILTVLLRLPMGLPPMVAGVILLLTFGPYALFGKVFAGHFVDTLLGVCGAQTFVAAPFVIEGSRGAFLQLDPYLHWAGRNIGLSEVENFVFVGLPSAWSGVRTSVLLGWLRAMGEFGATVLVAFHPYSLPILAFVNFDGGGLASTLSVVEVTVLVTLVGAIGLSAIPYPRKLAFTSIKRSVKKGHAMISRSDIDRGTVELLKVEVACRLSQFDLDLAFTSGFRTSVLGYSGAGKSALLAGIVGAWELYGVQGKGRVLWSTKRGDWLEIPGSEIVLVPQFGALFPHLNVREHLEIAQMRSGADSSLFDRLVEVFDLDEVLESPAKTLSGGQRQRASIASGILQFPKLILLDEPFSALDAPRRSGYQLALSELLMQFNIASILVTHDISEAAILGDSIVVVSDGSSAQFGSSGEVIRAPVNSLVASLVGYQNIIDCEPEWRPVFDGLPSKPCNKLAFRSNVTILTAPDVAADFDPLAKWLRLSGAFRVALASDMGDYQRLVLFRETDGSTENQRVVVEHRGEFDYTVGMTCSLWCKVTDLIPLTS